MSDTAVAIRQESGALTGRSSSGVPPAPKLSDALDNPDFDAVKFLNDMFPTEASLVGLDPLISTLRAKIRRVDGEILTAVRQQASSGGCSRKDLAQARDGIGELFGRVAAIRHQAEASEAMVQDICRDIRKLDHAKSHLTATITAFRRLSMLVTAVDQLQRAVERNEYAECAQLIEAVQQLAGHFQSFVAIPKVAELSARVSTLQRSVQANAMREFELLGANEDKPNPLLLDRLRACCAVIDALGPKAREELTDTMCRKEMGVYTAIFSTTGDTAALERTDRRYLWLRKRLAARKEVWGIFPEPWHLQQLVCRSFCAITKAHLAEILDAKAAELPTQVEALLRAVNATNDFENELAARFGTSDKSVEAEEGDEAEATDDGTSPSDVRSRYERLFKERQAAEQQGAEDGAAGVMAPPPPVAPFQASISSAFTKHLSCYVEAQERELLATLDSLIAEETWAPGGELDGGGGGGAGVLRSASALFAVIKTSLLRCSKYITRGPALLQLMNTFQKVVQSYAARLTARLPKTAIGATSGTPQLGNMDWHVRLGDNDVGACCAVVTTSEYCTGVVAALAANVAKLLDPPLGEQVDVGDEEEAFAGVSTAALNVLLLGVETRLDAHLGLLMRTNWAGIDSVGDQSDWVTAIGRTLAEVGPQLGSSLPDHHWAFLCDKLGSGFSRRLGEAVLRCRKISEPASQQLQLDASAVRSLLLSFPSSGGQGEPSATFTAAVNRELGRTGALLKVVGSRPDTLVQTFATLLPDGSQQDFQRIVELKVLKKSEAAALVDAYNQRFGRGGPSQATSTATPTRSAGTPVLPRVPSAASAAAAAQAVFREAGPSSATAQRVQASTQEFASRFKTNANTAAQRASAAAGSTADRMRESFSAMKMLSFGMGRNTNQSGGGGGGGGGGYQSQGRR